MRVAIVSDIHGNLTALEAVIRDLRGAAADVVLHGGDLADGGSRPAEVVDRIRELGWRGVMGNGEETLVRPGSLEEFAAQSRAPGALWEAVREMAQWARSGLGEERIAWLGGLERMVVLEELALVHASPGDCWRAPGEEDLVEAFRKLERPVAVYGHIHRPFVRDAEAIRVINSGSVGLPYDGDPRAAYLLLDGDRAEIRRVEYDVEREIRELRRSGLPQGDWVARMLRAGAMHPLPADG